MTRGEFMSDLSILLQDIPAEEREEALQYYKDYFEDAGIENEYKILKELESPQKVAETIKGSVGEEGYRGGEYQETGYSEPRYEDKKSPVKRGELFDQPKDKSNSWVKIILIALLILIGVPIILPIVIAVLAVFFSLIIACFAVLLSLVIVGVSLVIAGIGLCVTGIIRLFIDFPLGIAILGSGLILGAIGCIATVAMWQLCRIAFPALMKFIVDVSRKIFYRKEVAR